MVIDDVSCRAKGVVSPSFIDVKTGERLPFSDRCNTLSYMSAEAVAAAFGGNPSYIPARIGFIYGTDDQMPTESVITRRQSWSSLLEELHSSAESVVVDVQVVGFSYPPTLGAAKPEPKPEAYSSSSSSSDSGDDGSTDYGNIIPTGSNAITFHAVSNSQDRGAAFGSEAFSTQNYIYQAVLLGYHLGDLYIISRVSLKEGDAYLTKPKGFEVALDWTVSFY